MKPTIFLDRDGVINRYRYADYVKQWEEFDFLPGVFDAFALMSRSKYLICIITNQSGIGRGKMSIADLEMIHKNMVEEIEFRGGRIDAIYYCPHRPDEACDCRKPKPGLIYQAVQAYSIDLKASYLISDSIDDVMMAKRADLKPILVLSGKVGFEFAPFLLLEQEHIPVYRDLNEAVRCIFSGIE